MIYVPMQVLAIYQNIIKVYNHKPSYAIFKNMIHKPHEYVSAKGITNHSYSPNLVLEVIFHLSPSFILIC